MKYFFLAYMCVVVINSFLSEVTTEGWLMRIFIVFCLAVVYIAGKIEDENRP
jgi:hypothetical protein